MLRINKVFCLFSLFVIGFFIICFWIFDDIIYVKKLDKKIDNYFKISYNVSSFNSKEDNLDAYSGVLEIPSINLLKGFYDLSSRFNSVSNGLEILSGSVFPGEDYSLVMFASHSGNSKVSYFNNLTSVKTGDKVNLYYKGNKYVYTITKCDISRKDGFIRVRSSDFKNVIVLTTCLDGESLKQYTCYGVIS